MRHLVIGFVCLIAFPSMAKNVGAAKPRAPVPTCGLAYSDQLRAVRSLADRSGISVYPIEGADVDRFLAVFNAAEPKTDFKAEKILVAVNAQFAYVEMFVGGCVSNEGKLAPSSFDLLMRQAFGNEIPNGLAI